MTSITACSPTIYSAFLTRNSLPDGILSQLAALLVWSQPLHAAAVAVLVAMQVRMMLVFIAAPREKALWYSGFGVPLYVLGMMVTAFAIRGLVA